MKKILIWERIKAPTPKFFKKLINISLSVAAGAGAALMAEPIGKAIITDFTYTLFPWVETVCKNLVVIGIVAAAIAKTTVENKPTTFEKPSAPNDDNLKNT